MNRVLVTIPSVLLSLVAAGCGGDGAGTGSDAVGSTDPTAPGASGAGAAISPGGGAAPGGTSPGGVTPGGDPGAGPTPTGGIPDMTVGGTPTGVVPPGGAEPLPGSGGAGGPDPIPLGNGGTGVVPGGGGAPPLGNAGTPPVAMGGGGGMDVVPGPPEPSLVTSGEGAYWTVGEVVVGGAAANITVNSEQTFQDWHGWGGTFNEAGWAALQALSEADRQMAISLLFSTTDGLGLDWGRIPIGPSDYAVSRYHLSSGPGDFSIDHDRQSLIPYIQAAQAVKGDVKYWASPWTPPPWMKTGTTENDGYDKGIFDTQYFQDYADFFVSWIQAYEAEEIPIDHVMPQNEPGWAQSYPTCAFGPARDSTNNTDIPNEVTLGTFVDGYLFPSLDAAGLTTDVWYGTLSNDAFFSDYFNDMMSKPTANRIVGVGLQWETQVRVGEVANAGLLVMQSEHKCGNYPWLAPMASSSADADRNNFLASMAPNNHAYGEESWDLIKGWIEDGVNIYSAWNMVLDTGGFNLDMVRPWPQNALLAVDTAAGSLQVTAYYYVFRHVAQYVDAGAVRVGVSGGNALAFKNPDGSIVTVMFNDGAAPSSTTLDVDGTMLQFDIPARGWATVNWQG